MGVDPVHVLLGPETGQKGEHIESLVAALEKEHSEAPERYRYYAFEMDATELVGLLYNNSLFSRHQLVSVIGAEAITKKNDISKIAAYIESPSHSSTLILVSDEFRIDRRIERAATKRRVKVFRELFDNQKRGFVQGFFRSAGRTITSSAVEFLLELVSNDTAHLRVECERLLLFFDNAEIGEQEVEELVYHSKQENVFSLFSKVAAADLEGSIEVVHALFAGGAGDAGQILSGLTWQLRNLVAFRRLKDQHFSDEEIARRLGIRGKRSLHSYRTGGSRYSLTELERVFVRTLDYEAIYRQMPAGFSDKLFELFLYEVIVLRGKRPLLGGSVARA